MREGKIAFIGSGMIGSGLAINCVMHGIPVSLQTRRQVDLCRQRMEDGLKFFADKNVISAEEAEKAKELYTITTSIEEALEGAVMVQESGPDDVALKRQLVEQIEQYVADDVIIASSTSSRSITEIFAEAKHPERCMGGHPYHPAYLIPLVEITKGEKTADAYAQEAKGYYEKMGKIPVILNQESIGFIANRYQSAIHREAVDLVERGVCSVEDADKALVYGVGMRWNVLGQFLSMHLSAAPEGIGAFNEKFHVDPTQPDYRLSHMPTWTTFPADWTDLAQKGLEEAIADRPPETGNDIPSIEAWRDDMLVADLRLHKLL